MRKARLDLVIACLVSAFVGFNLSSCTTSKPQASNTSTAAPVTTNAVTGAPAGSGTRPATQAAHDDYDYDDCAEMQEKLDSVRSALDDAQGDLSTLERKVRELEYAVDDFGTADWRSVVPDVEDAAFGVKRATSDLASALESIEAELD